MLPATKLASFSWEKLAAINVSYYLKPLKYLVPKNEVRDLQKENNKLDEAETSGENATRVAD